MVRCPLLSIQDKGMFFCPKWFCDLMVNKSDVSDFPLTSTFKAEFKKKSKHIKG